MYKTLNIIITLALFHSVNALHAQPFSLFINEFMASNTQTVTDEAGEYDDWLEIYNANEYSISLQNFYLTDDFTKPTQWAFPNVTISPKNFDIRSSSIRGWTPVRITIPSV